MRQTSSEFSPARRKFLARATAAGAVSLIPATIKAGDYKMATKDEIRPASVRDTETPNLFLIEDLDRAEKTKALAEIDLKALRAVADWTKTFIIHPSKELGRAGPVCPFTVVALERKTLWLAPERSEGRSTESLVKLIENYKRLLLDSPPLDGSDAEHKSIVVVFSDLPAASTKDFLGRALEQIGVSSYVNDGLVMGPFFEGNDGTAIYNPNFRPFTSPVPFLLMRRAVVSDWKFFLNDKDWFERWAHRYGQSGLNERAKEMRRLPWNARRD